MSDDTENDESRESAGEVNGNFGYDESALEKAFVKSIMVHGHDRVVWSRAELAVLAQNIKTAPSENDRLAAIHALACTALRYMLKLANKYRRRTSHHVSILDVFSWGYLGLVRAAEDYDPTRSTFTTYATAWVHQSITSGFLEKGRSVYVPIHKAKKSFQFLHTWEAMRAELGREPQIGEIARECDITIVKAEDLRRVLTSELSLDAPAGPDVDGGMDDSLVSLLAGDESDIPENLVAERESNALIWSHLARLDEKERDVLIARFGLRDEDPINLLELGERYGVTRERVRQIESKALEKLRRWMAEERGVLL